MRVVEGSYLRFYLRSYLRFLSQKLFQDFYSKEYFSFLDDNLSKYAQEFTSAPWNEWRHLSSGFRIHKIHGDFIDICKLHSPKMMYDIIYFDAFSPDKHPQAWDDTMFTSLFSMMNKGGILVTYCSKGIVKQALRNAGFIVKRLAGPPGKRHIIRAIKE